MSTVAHLMLRPIRCATVDRQLLLMSSKSPSGPRDYKWSFKFYEDSTDYDIKEVLYNLQNYFHDWVWIKHDKDRKEFQRKRLRSVSDLCTRSVLRSETEKLIKSGVIRKPFRKLHIPLAKPHIHFYGKNDNHCRISKLQIVKWLHLPYSYNFRPEDIKPCWSWVECVKYSVHRNAPEKYQYPLSCARTNMRDFYEIVMQNRSMVADLRTLYWILDQRKDSGKPLPYYELVRIMTQQGCTLQLARPSMVERISRSYQFNEMGVTVE